MKKCKKELAINEEGVFGGRGMGVFANMFVLEYIFELYTNVVVCIICVLAAIVGIIVLRKDFSSFFTENEWKKNFYILYVLLNWGCAGAYGLVGYFFPGCLLVIVDDVSMLAKAILIVTYGLVAWNTIVPNSVIMRVASRNARLR